MKELRDEFGITCDHGALYRTLHALEAGALIRSHWDADDLGPARRVYELTRRETTRSPRGAMRSAPIGPRSKNSSTSITG